MNKMFTFMRESAVARSLIPVGLLLMVFGVIVLFISIKNSNYIQIESVVTNVKLVQDTVSDEDGTHVVDSYDVTVKYTVDGNEYEGELSGVSKFNVGDKMKIYYNPENPNEITQTKSLIIPIVIIVGGLIAFIGGIISAVNAVKKHKQMKEQEKGWANAN